MRTTEYLLPLIKLSCRNSENIPLLEHVGSETPSGSREEWGNTAEVLRSLSSFLKGLYAKRWYGPREMAAFSFCQSFKSHAMQHANPVPLQSV